mmetsp:Transcript_49912/g.150107  ORF Transcript_49912/g.150107 Transcript_49912/m.150107 type:complete len:235 (-) Transcript_49912:346-1050(-)
MTKKGGSEKGHPGATGARPKRSRYALILLDVQNEFVSEGGKLNDGVSALMKDMGMIEKMKRLLSAAREADALIIHSPVIMKSGETFEEPDFDPQNYSKLHGLFTEGTWNCDFVDGLRPLDDSEIVLTGRNDFCAFKGTELQSILEDGGVKKLFVCGFLTNLCVEETARAATERVRGLKVTVVIDCCAAKTREEHINVIEHSLPLYCSIMRCEEVENKLGLWSHAKSKFWKRLFL